MYQLVSVYFANGCFLAHPNSTEPESGALVAHHPGVGISQDSPDEFLGEALLSLRSYCKDPFPQPLPLNALPFPLASVAGIKTWATLEKKSPILIHIRFSEFQIEVVKNVKDGSGYSLGKESPTLSFPASISPIKFGAAIRNTFVTAP